MCRREWLCNHIETFLLIWATTKTVYYLLTYFPQMVLSHLPLPRLCLLLWRSHGSGECVLKKEAQLRALWEHTNPILCGWFIKNRFHCYFFERHWRWKHVITCLLCQSAEEVSMSWNYLMEKWWKFTTTRENPNVNNNTSRREKVVSHFACISPWAFVMKKCSNFFFFKADQILK